MLIIFLAKKACNVFYKFFVLALRFLFIIQAQQMTMQAMAMVTTSPISSPPTSPPPTPYIPYTPLPSSPYSALPPSPYANFPPSPYAQVTPSSYTVSSCVTSNPGLNHRLKTTQTSQINRPERVRLYLTFVYMCDGMQKHFTC